MDKKLLYKCWNEHYWLVDNGNVCNICDQKAVGKPFYRTDVALGVEDHEFENGGVVRVYNLKQMPKEYNDGTMLIGDFDEVMDKLGF